MMYVDNVYAGMYTVSIDVSSTTGGLFTLYTLILHIALSGASSHFLGSVHLHTPSTSMLASNGAAGRRVRAVCRGQLLTGHAIRSRCTPVQQGLSVHA
jgi:hypothetical protein